MTATRTPLIDVWQQPCDLAGCGDLVLVEQDAATIRVLLVDASGHGPRAAEVAGAFERIARPAMGRRITAETFRSWNRQLGAVLAPSQFVAVTAIEIDIRRGRCVVWNAGNPAPSLVRQPAEALRKLGDYGLPLGAFGEEMYEAPEPCISELRADEAVVLISDGVTDQCRGEEPFGEQRLGSCFVDATIRGASISDELRRAIEVYRAGQAINDDMSVVVIRGNLAVPASREVPAAAAA